MKKVCFVVYEKTLWQSSPSLNAHVILLCVVQIANQDTRVVISQYASGYVSLAPPSRTMYQFCVFCDRHLCTKSFFSTTESMLCLSISQHSFHTWSNFFFDLMFFSFPPKKMTDLYFKFYIKNKMWNDCQKSHLIENWLIKTFLIIELHYKFKLLSLITVTFPCWKKISLIYV